jgi:hypothetical protein
MDIQLIMYTGTYITFSVVFILKIKTYHTTLHEYKSTETISVVIHNKLLIITFI